MTIADVMLSGGSKQISYVGFLWWRTNLLWLCSSASEATEDGLYLFEMIRGFA